MTTAHSVDPMHRMRLKRKRKRGACAARDRPVVKWCGMSDGTGEWREFLQIAGAEAKDSYGKKNTVIDDHHTQDKGKKEGELSRRNGVMKEQVSPLKTERRDRTRVQKY